jgi:hypothetical protein
MSSHVFWHLLPAWRHVPLIREDDTAAIREQLLELAKQFVLIH